MCGEIIRSVCRRIMVLHPGVQKFVQSVIVKTMKRNRFAETVVLAFFGYDNENYKYQEARQKPVSESKAWIPSMG